MLAYAFLGLLAGVLAGLFGIGGGLILVPALLWLLPAEIQAIGAMHWALGTAFACILGSGLMSAWTHHQQGAVQQAWLFRLLPGLLLGTLLGTGVAAHLTVDWLQSGFGIFELLIAAHLWRTTPRSAATHAPQVTSTAQLIGAGGLIGFLSAFLGIGGGTLSTPYLHWRGLPLRQAIGTAAAGGVPIALAGTVGYIATGWRPSAGVAWSSGYVYWPAVMGIVLTSLPAARWGALLTHRLPVRLLQRGFAVLLASIGLGLLGTL